MSQETMQAAKSELQASARAAWKARGSKGTLAACTGVGKTKPAIDEMMELWDTWHFDHAKSMEDGYKFTRPKHPKIIVVVPTETLRDEGWPAEVKKWYGDEGSDMWGVSVTPVCYASLHKYDDGEWDLVILDEVHNLTAMSAQFFFTSNNTVKRVLGLTATFPDRKQETFKWDLLQNIAPICFTYPLDQGVEDGLVSDFEINVVLTVLDNKDKYIEAGNAKKRFFQTEQGQYDYLHKIVKGLQIKASVGVDNTGRTDKALMMMQMKLNRFIYTLRTKERLAKAVMDQEIGTKRCVVFAGGIEQSGRLCGKEVYDSKHKTNGALERFMSKETNILGAVSALNEGVNLNDVDMAIIVQVDSNPRTMTQRLGRVVRWREDHTAKIFILCVQNTLDESWLKNSLQSFDPKRIKYLASRSYLP